MFHPSIIDRRIRILESQFHVRLYHYTVEESRYITEIQLESKRNPKTNKLEGLNLDEQLFIQNEILMSRASFPYWFCRYPQIILDDALGEKGHPKLWRSQEVMLERMGERELTSFKQFDTSKGGQDRYAGNRWYVHKARACGLSTVCEAIPIHTGNFYSDTNTLIGSKNLSKTQQVWRDYGHLMWESQPDWMRVPSAGMDHAEKGLILANGSKFMLQHSEQESGFGQGAKWHRSHLTEIADWSNSTVSNQIDNHYWPACSRSIKSAHFLESTSQGRGNYWHKSTERARAKRLNDWWYLFIPWWLIPDLYVTTNIPVDWEIDPKTVQEEELIIRESPEWNEGKTYRPSREQLYWWERTRATDAEKHTLHEFYKNYPSIPEQSFTHSGRSSFSYDTLEWCESRVREPYAYYLMTSPSQHLAAERVRTEREVDRLTGQLVDPPQSYTINDTEIVPVHVTDDEKVNPLGLVLAWETPKDVKPYDTYAGVDTTRGIESWQPDFTRTGDEDINNATISIIRSSSVIDTDVLEFAAPVTYKPLARLFNLLARVWVGRNANDGQVPTIVELNGDGMAFQEELISAYDFFNFYQHFDFTGADWKETNKYGWTSTPKSVRYLWSFFKSHITDHHYIPRSRHLVGELRNCTDDEIYVGGMTRGTAPKKGGRHDDRVYSRAFAIWYANSWANPQPKPQRSQVPVVSSHGQKKLKLHQMDFRSPEEKEAYLEGWDLEMLSRM